jgi:hypothetical protein
MLAFLPHFWQWMTAADNALLMVLRVLGNILADTSFISALAGAFAGAGAAFYLETRRRRREKRERRYEALLRAQSALLAQGNSLSWFEAQYPDENRFDNLKTIVLGFTRQLVNFDELGFLGASKRPQLIIELDVANESFDQFRRLAELRNETIEEFFSDPGTEVLEFDESTGRIRAKGSLRLKYKLQQLSEGVSLAFTSAKARNAEAIDAVLKFGRKEFPRMSIPYPKKTESASVKPNSTDKNSKVHEPSDLHQRPGV